MALVAFVAEHLKRINAAKGTAREVANMAGVGATLERLAAAGLAKTILAPSGTVLGIIGAAPVLPGVCEVFVVASKEQKRSPIIFAKVVREELYTLKEKYRRIQVVALNDQFHARWLSWLGFCSEGVLKQYGLHGEDMVMWRLV